MCKQLYVSTVSTLTSVHAFIFCTLLCAMMMTGLVSRSGREVVCLVGKGGSTSVRQVEGRGAGEGGGVTAASLHWTAERDGGT